MKAFKPFAGGDSSPSSSSGISPLMGPLNCLKGLAVSSFLAVLVTLRNRFWDALGVELIEHLPLSSFRTLLPPLSEPSDCFLCLTS